MRNISFHKPFTNAAIEAEVLEKLKNNWFEETGDMSYFGDRVPLPFFVHSATAALEVMALVLGIKPGDEVILPSFTYVATGNAFAKLGATLVFADIEADTLNIDSKAVEKLITHKTKAVVPIHYGGNAADLNALKNICNKAGAFLIEDAAHCVGAYFENQPLGTHGLMGCLSFHATKNITSGGVGGALWVKKKAHRVMADEIIHQGTNRTAFLKQSVPNYSWKRLGGAYTMAVPQKIFLEAAIKKLDDVTKIRLSQWEGYKKHLQDFEKRGIIRIATPIDGSKGNGHIFYCVFSSKKQRDSVRKKLYDVGISTVSHYEPIHTPLEGKSFVANRMAFPNTNWATQGLLRLPIGPHLTDLDFEYVLEEVKKCLIDL